MFRSLFLVAVLQALILPSRAAQVVRVATYNVENYLDRLSGGRSAKSEEAKREVRESIRALQPDVLALQEIGSLSALLELRDSLAAEGLKLPHYEFVTGYDTNIFVAILSRFPFAGRSSHTNANFLYRGRRFRTTRGFGEVLVQVNKNYSFTLFAAHFKSQRPSAQADEDELRLQEARALREIVDARLAADPQANIVVAGDLNDSQNSPSTRWLIGRGKARLVDSRPSELLNREVASVARAANRTVAWTHHFAQEDTYSRIDYMLLSSGMARELRREETYVLSRPSWGLGSDHRPLVATFIAVDE